jgi:hypothetical protein
MLRKIDICALQVDAGRRPRWITPCKPQAQLGAWASSCIRTAKQFNPLRYGIVETRCIASLLGVIRIRRLPASIGSAQKVLRNISE